MKLLMTKFSSRHPWLIIVLTLVMTIAFASRFPQVHFDNDPENMLSADEPVRLFHHAVKEKYSLYDFVIVGIVNEHDPDGVFNVATLGRIYDLTEELLSLRQGKDGKPEVTLPARDERAASTLSLDLAPRQLWRRTLAFVFRHDANRLFDESGRSAIIGQEIISPSVVDNIKQGDFGSLKLEYLMEAPPRTREGALRIRDDAMNNPLYAGTLVSEDEKAICVYIPIIKKSYSYNVAALVRELTASWNSEDQIYITGLPVAEDTFGVEMLIQMATSAPMAGIVIFLLLLLFFRRINLILAPMIVAVITIICTMGLLIGLGYDVHIMSSMIAIFLMPIAVADSVHLLSEFFDTYHRFRDRAKTIAHVVGHLFRPMLFTSLTTIAGFASLGTTPIPPVRVFGLHVAFGVGLAWVLTMTLIPAYIMLFVSVKSLEGLSAAPGGKARSGILDPFLASLGRFSSTRWRSILIATLVLLMVAGFGMSRIRVNDNPVNWFIPSHPIRVADRVLNHHFGGTYTAYLTLAGTSATRVGSEQLVTDLAARAQVRFADTRAESLPAFEELLAANGDMVEQAGVDAFFQTLAAGAASLDESYLAAWQGLSDEINYLDAEGLNSASLAAALRGSDNVEAAAREVLIERLAPFSGLEGLALLEKALTLCEEITANAFREFVLAQQAELSAPLFKRPQMLHYVEALQQELGSFEWVGKTSSSVDALKKAAYELTFEAPPEGAIAEERHIIDERNRARFAVPDTVAGVGQVFTQLEGMKKKDSLFHLVTRDYDEVNIWVQLKSGDNSEMEHVVRRVEDFMARNPPPVAVNADWAGLTYLNVVWQDKMVRGMLFSLGSSFLVVLAMMILLFRSLWFGLMSMIPLSVTISLIYGLIGLVGKDYDMPVAVLSALTLGLSVDFAIHFLERARESQKQHGTWRASVAVMFKEPAMAISRNAITISVGFLPLLLAPLAPYRTVGFFLATIMAVSWLATLLILPALLTMMARRLFPAGPQAAAMAPSTVEPPATPVASRVSGEQQAPQV